MAYHQSKLVPLKAKGNIWYVQVTKPVGLQNGSNKQVRRSTGTTDRKEAERRQHRIADEIYRDFDEQLDRLKPQPALKFVYDMSPPDPLHAFRPKPVVPKVDPALLISRIRPQYIEGRPWNKIKTMNGADTHIKEFVSVVGDMEVGAITKKHAYDYAKFLSEQGRGNSTIRTRVSSVGGMLTWCEQQGHLETSPIVNLKLKHYGAATEHYKPLDHDELVKLFKQPTTPRERLILSILATTGMRLDEVALLRWDQVKKKGELVYLDLTDDVIVKNEGSKRMVPLHSGLIIPERGVGNMFNYPRDRDGKATNEASKACMPWIRAAIGNDPLKVVHSLRGTFKDLLRDLDISKELNDFITGHSSGDSAGDYGKGPSLAIRSSAIDQIDIAFLNQPDGV